MGELDCHVLISRQAWQQERSLSFLGQRREYLSPRFYLFLVNVHMRAHLRDLSKGLVANAAREGLEVEVDELVVSQVLLASKATTALFALKLADQEM